MKLNKAFLLAEKPLQCFSVFLISGNAFPVFLSVAFMPDCMTYNLVVFSPNNELKRIALDNIYKFFKKSIVIVSFILLAVSISTPIFLEFFRFRITSNLKPQDKPSAYTFDC